MTPVPPPMAERRGVTVLENRLGIGLIQQFGWAESHVSGTALSIG
jgi:hypothetical protein